ncbi:MAG: hypothetical protein ABIA97_02165 [Candidatus Omnitrophota bacterium]
MNRNQGDGSLNIKFGWIWLLIGIIEAAFIGMYAFKSDWLGGYTSLARRFIRLSHIAFMALSIVNIIYGLYLPLVQIPNKIKKVGSYSMILAAISMPLICILSAFQIKFQALFFMPVLFFIIAVVIMIIGQSRSKI